MMFPSAYNRTLALFALYAFVVAFVVTGSGLCLSNSIAFRPMLSKDDLQGKRFDALKDGKDAVYIWRLRYLADRDIAKVDIFRSASAANRLLVGFTVNEDGAKRLRHFTKKFGMRRLAIFADSKLLGMIPAVPPTFMGDRIVVKWPGTEKELRAFAARINNKPPGIMALYIEEMDRYNDVAVDAWAKAYEDVNKYIEAKRNEGVASKALVDELRGQDS